MSQLSPSELLYQLQSYTSSPPNSLSDDPEFRSQLYYAAQAAMVSFEDSPNPISRVAVAYQAEWVAMRTSCDIGLYPALATNSEPKTLVELAQITRVDPALLLRFVRAGVSFGSIKESGSEHYTLSPSYSVLADPKVSAALPKFADFVHGTFYATPNLLAQSGYQNPNDPLNTAMQLAFNAPGKAPYEIFVSKPENAKAIGTMMGVMGVSKLQRIESVYPIRERLVTGFDETLQDAFFVDVGAGNGHVVLGLRSAMPGLPGRLIAQDLPSIISSISISAPGVERQAYDFFTEQPIKQARAYYIRLCLHNWQDKECIAILTRIRKAMKPKYSRLIIHEQVMPDHGTHPWASVSDINQMGATASFERTKGDWAALLKEVGLEEPKFYFPKDPSSAVAIESILKG